MSNRMKFQMQFAQGRIVNLGCGDCPVDFGPNSVNVDYDVYNYKNFVHADIHNMPMFKDNEFDTAVMGDILEHCYDPVQALREAGRISKRLVATVFEEWRVLPGGYDVQDKKKMEDLKAMGFDTQQAYFESLESHRDKIVEVKDDDKIPHHSHLHMFTDESLLDIIEKAGLEVVIWRKELDGYVTEGQDVGHPFYNWLLVLRKKEHKEAA